MKSILRALTAVIALPATASAGALVFDCSIEDASQPEMAARLTEVEGQTIGIIQTAGSGLEALIYEGPDTRTFLFLGDDYSLNYTVNLDTGAYEYFADGSKSAKAVGTCLPATAKVAGDGGAAARS